MATIVYAPLNGRLSIQNELGIWMDPTDAITDLTANSKDLTSVGSLTKSPVATGASSFAYGDFSASNYLTRAYDADFDLLGTGHTLMAWVNPGSGGSTQNIVDRQDTGATGARYNLSIDGSGFLTSVVDDGTDTVIVTDNTDLRSLGWSHVAMTWDGVDTTTLYVNGVPVVVDSSGAAVGSVVNATAIFRIGIRATNSEPFGGEIAGVKLLAFDHTAATILATYNSEKSMFVTDATFVENGSATSIVFPAMVMNRGGSAISSVADSIGGNRQVIFDREDVTWDIQTSELTGPDILLFQHMLSTMLRGAQFTLDPYDLSEVVTCKIQSNNYAASRIDTSEYLTFAFGVKEV